MELKLTVWAQPLCRGVKEPGGAEEERSVLVVEEGVEGVEEGHADGLGGGGANAAVVLEEVVEYEAQLGICQNVSKGLQSEWPGCEKVFVCRYIENVGLY